MNSNLEEFDKVLRALRLTLKVEQAVWRPSKTVSGLYTRPVPYAAGVHVGGGTGEMSLQLGADASSGSLKPERVELSAHFIKTTEGISDILKWSLFVDYEYTPVYLISGDDRDVPDVVKREYTLSVTKHNNKTNETNCTVWANLPSKVVDASFLTTVQLAEQFAVLQSRRLILDMNDMLGPDFRF